MTGAASGDDIGPDVTRTILDFSQLDGWEGDDHQAALDVFLSTCGDMAAPDWRALCRAAADQGSARTFFELFFRPVLIEDGAPGLFTGYFEPELDGSLTPDDVHRFPVYAM
ncbi:MAG: murein transglycosylase, partial [Pseudooceanicola nanhaiensis]